MNLSSPLEMAVFGAVAEIQADLEAVFGGYLCALRMSPPAEVTAEFRSVVVRLRCLEKGEVSSFAELGVVVPNAATRATVAKRLRDGLRAHAALDAHHRDARQSDGGVA